MSQRTPTRHMEFYRLVEALAEPGCPACRFAAAAAQRWLEDLFRELVNDPSLRRGLRRAGSLCAAHAYQAMRLGDALGSSIIYGDLLRHALAQGLRAWKPACPVCQHEAEAGRAALALLLDHIQEEDVRAAYEASEGLCLSHLREAVTRRRSDRAALLVRLEERKVAALAGECDVFVEKADYRQRDAKIGDEGHAWRRAARKLAGTFYPEGPDGRRP